MILLSPRGRSGCGPLSPMTLCRVPLMRTWGAVVRLGPKAWQECNINDLTDLTYDPISGFPIYKALLCEVAKAPESGETLEIDSGESVPHFLASTHVPRLAVEDRIYLDHNATTPPDPEVQAYGPNIWKPSMGIPPAIHREGRDAKAAIEEARRKVAKLLGCTARRIIFTGGGSEANNQVIKGWPWPTWNGKKSFDHLIDRASFHSENPAPGWRDTASG